MLICLKSLRTLFCSYAIYLSIYLSQSVHVYLSIYLSIWVCSNLIYLSESVHILSIYLSIYLFMFIYLSINLSIWVCSYLIYLSESVHILSIYLSIWVCSSIYLSIYLSISICSYAIYLSIYLSQFIFYLSIYLSICLYLSIYLSIYLGLFISDLFIWVSSYSIYLSIYLSIYHFPSSYFLLSITFHWLYIHSYWFLAANLLKYMNLSINVYVCMCKKYCFLLIEILLRDKNQSICWVAKMNICLVSQEESFKTKNLSFFFFNTKLVFDQGKIEIEKSKNIGMFTNVRRRHSWM